MFRSFRFAASLLIALVVTLSCVPALAWHDTGHMISAYIAWSEMKPEVRQQVAQILKQHPRYKEDLLRDMPEGFTDVDLYAFLKASTWPDLVRDRNNPMNATDHHSTWHYIDYPIVAPADADKIKAPMPDETSSEIDNALKAMNAMAAIIRDSGAAADKKAVAICWLSHLIGDIHQPLHASSYFSTQFPEGDRGGNSFIIRTDGDVTNLHTFWDGIFGPATTPAGIKLLASNILANPNNQRPAMDAEMQAHATYKSWILESNAECREFVYLNGKLRSGSREARSNGTTPTTAPATLTTGRSGRNGDPNAVPAVPEGYEDIARQLSDQRISLAGHRLADQYNSLLGQK